MLDTSGLAALLACKQVVTVLVVHPRLRTCAGLKRRFVRDPEFVFLPLEGSHSVILANARRFAPCVLVIDEDDGNEPDFFEAADRAGSNMRILVACRTVTPDLAVHLARAGAMGCIAENASATVMKKAIAAVSRGEMWFERRVLTSVIQQFRSAAQSPSLTKRESDILQLIARGYTNRAIASELSVSPATIRWHLRRLHTKLGVRDRGATAIYAHARFEAGAEPLRPLADAS